MPGRSIENGDGQANPVDSGTVQAAFGSADESDLCGGHPGGRIARFRSELRGCRSLGLETLNWAYLPGRIGVGVGLAWGNGGRNRKRCRHVDLGLSLAFIPNTLPPNDLRFDCIASSSMVSEA